MTQEEKDKKTRLKKISYIYIYIYIYIDLLSVDSDQIVVSHKFKHNDEGFKYFIVYLKGEIIKPLCIILPQMSGYIKYFENGSKNMSSCD